jgi:hypothetical protein
MGRQCPEALASRCTQELVWSAGDVADADLVNHAAKPQPVGRIAGIASAADGPFGVLAALAQGGGTADGQARGAALSITAAVQGVHKKPHRNVRPSLVAARC